MKRIAYGIIMCLFASMVQATGSRNLMLIMNWTDETLNDGQPFGAISQVTISALEQKAGPVIVSSQTWRSVMGRGTNPRYPDYDISREVFYDNPSFRYNEWIIKRLSDYLYLFVPKSYLAAMKAKNDSHTQDLNTLTMFTQDERVLGLKISKFPDISQTDLYNVAYHKSYIALKEYPGLTRKNAHSALQHLTSSGNEEIAETYLFSQHVLYMLGKILITRADIVSKVNPVSNLALFKQETEVHEALLLHEWLVYLDGHGSKSGEGFVQPVVTQLKGRYPAINNIGITSGLEHNSFQSVLKFFNGSVVTGALLYTSCYAGGPHLAKLFEGQWEAFLRNPEKQIKKDSYNYLVMMTNIWYTATESAVLDYVQFPTFFTLLHAFVHPAPGVQPAQKKYVKGKPKQAAKKGSTFEVTAQLANIITQVTQFDLRKRFQVPGVRFPYTEWFVAIDDPTLPVMFEKSNNRLEQSKTSFVKQKKTAALNAALKNKFGVQQQAKALKQEPPLVAMAEQRAKELEAIRRKEEEAKGKKLYSGIMKLQQKENAGQAPGVQPTAQPVVGQPKMTQPVQKQPAAVAVPPVGKPGPIPAVQQQPTPISSKLTNALNQLQSTLNQLVSRLQIKPLAVYPVPVPQPYYQVPAPQPYYQPDQEEEEEQQEAEDEYDQQEEGEPEGDYYPQGDYYYYVEDGSDYDEDEDSY